MLEKGLPKAGVRIVASLKQQNRGEKDNRGQSLVLPRHRQRHGAWTAEETGPGSYGRAGLRPSSGQCLGVKVGERSPRSSLACFCAR